MVVDGKARGPPNRLSKSPQLPKATTEYITIYANAISKLNYLVSKSIANDALRLLHHSTVNRS